MKGKKYFVLIGAFSLILSSSLIIVGEWEVPTQLTFSLTNDSHPSLFVDSKGNIHLTWFGWDGNDNEIFYTYSVNGTFISVIKVTNNDGNDQLPSLFLDSNGTAYIAWSGNENGNYDIYYSKYIFIQNENEKWWLFPFILAIMIIGEIIFFLILKLRKNKKGI